MAKAKAKTVVKAKSKTSVRAKAKPVAARRKRADEVRARLALAMGTPECELDHANAFELVIATILSAQSTDKMVNKVTPALFARWPTPAALAAAPQEEVEVAVKSTGFFRNKAKSIRGAAEKIQTLFGGEVPRTIDEITKLPGVARKTGNVVLGTAYRIATGVTVDTHVGRVARRLELTEHDDPVKVEQDLMALAPESEWIDLGHRMVLHGRYVCLARKPRCADCVLNEVCPSAEAAPTGTVALRASKEGEAVSAGRAASRVR